MNMTYDHERARKLIPLLESITSELAYRTHELRILQGRLTRLGDEPSNEFMDLKARLAMHRREIRYSLGELDRLGCLVHESNPSLVLIPGLDGEFEHGYQVDLRSGSLRRADLRINAA